MACQLFSAANLAECPSTVREREAGRVFGRFPHKGSRPKNGATDGTATDGTVSRRHVLLTALAPMASQ